MGSTLRIIVGTLLAVFLTEVSSAGDLVVSGAVTISADTTFDNILVQSGGVLTADGAIVVAGNTTVNSGGFIRHSAYPTNAGSGLQLNIGGKLIVNGTIEANARGLRGGVNGPGQTYNSAGSVIAIVGIDIGGSYGGVGGRAALSGSYGVVEFPMHMGSGGGGYNGAGGGTGGNGGGLIRITASKVELNGVISVNGGNNATGNGGGGGSGGGISIHADSITGSGLITANGGNGSGFSGSGAGGRIAVYFGYSELNTSQFQARGSTIGNGAANAKGSAGTVYLKDNAKTFGSLILNNNMSTASTDTPLKTNETGLEEMVLQGQSRLLIDSSWISEPFSIAGKADIGGTSFLSLNSGADVVFSGSFPALTASGNSQVIFAGNSQIELASASLNGSGTTLWSSVDLEFDSSQYIVVNSGSLLRMNGSSILTLPSLNGTILQSGNIVIDSEARLVVVNDTIVVPSGSCIYKDGSFGGAGDFVSFLSVQPGAFVRHTQYGADNSGSGLILSAGALEVGGTIDANARGLRGGVNGPGQTYNAGGVVVASVGIDIGGSYGGVGGRASPGAAYGLVESPMHMGSGGGGYNGAGGGTGGNGGGLIRITAHRVQLNGAISANGGNNATGNGGGGGSGGGISIHADSIVGSGQITANGGNGSGFSGSGAGGRIAVYYRYSELNTSQFQARGSTVGNSATNAKGSAGTIYLYDEDNSFSRLLIDNGSSLSIQETPLRSDLSNVNILRVIGNGRLRIDGSYLTQAFSITDSCSVIGAGAFLEVAPATTVSFPPVRPALYIAEGGDVNFSANSFVNMPSVTVTGSGSSFSSYVNLTFTSASDLLVSSAGQVALQAPSTMTIPTLGVVSIQNGASFIIHKGARLNVLSEEVTVPASCSLYKDGFWGATGDQIQSLVVEAGASLLHSPYPDCSDSGVVINVSNSVRILGLIDANARGLRGGFRSSNPSALGETYNSSGAVVPAVGIDVGASYGGIGGKAVATATYGVSENPGNMGSGGGGYNGAGGGSGGNGGGLIYIVASILQLEGEITADGGNNATGNGGGGGSGGGIQIVVDSIYGGGLITANGGNGSGFSGSGAGGRIAVFAESNQMLPNQYQARGSTIGNSASDAKASAGTVYLKNLITQMDKLIVDNNNSISTLTTPFASEKTSIDSILIANLSRFRFNETYEVPENGSLGLFNAMVFADSGIIIDSSGSFFGIGTINGSVLNYGSCSPGNPTGAIALNGNYQQGHLAKLQINVAASGVFGRLVINNGLTIIDGVVEFSLDNGFVPAIGSRFNFVKHVTRYGAFGSVQGIGAQLAAVSYIDTSVVLIVDHNFSTNSEADPVLITSPAGTIPYQVILRDESGSPIAGSNNVWLDLSPAMDVIPCLDENTWPIVYPDTVTDINGNIKFWVRAGGCTTDSVHVMTSHGEIARVPIKSIDHNGGLYVKLDDFVGDACNDYNNDAVVDYADLDFFSTYLGQTCVGSPSQYFDISIYTSPPPGSIFSNDTIQVCASLSNRLGVDGMLDSIEFSTAGWGIAQPWTEFAQMNSIPVGPRDTLSVCSSYIVPAAGHGCFRARIFPSYPNRDGVASRLLDPSCNECLAYEIEYDWTNIEPRGCPIEGGNPDGTCGSGIAVSVPRVKSRKDCKGKSGDCTDAQIEERMTFVSKNCDYKFDWKKTWDCTIEDANGNLGQCRDNYINCIIPDGPLFDCTEEWLQELIVCNRTVLSQRLIWRRWNHGGGDCGSTPPSGPASPRPGDKPPCNPDPPKQDQQNIDIRTKQKNLARDDRALATFSVPIGSEYGDSLRLHIFPYLPEGWAYSISDSGWVTTPTSIEVQVDYPANASDTGRIVFHAYNSEDDYAGNAELWVIPEYNCGDLSGNGQIDIGDAVYLINYIFAGGPNPVDIRGGDVNCDSKVNITDAVYLVNYTFAGGPVPCAACP